MEIIAMTEKGVLVQATTSEIKEILNAVTGKKPEKLNIGDKIPAIDYSATLTKIKSLQDDSYFKDLVHYSERFTNTVTELKEKVNALQNIELK